MGQDHPGEGGGQHQHHQPGRPGPPGLKHAGFQIGLVAGQDGGHLLDVLGGLLLQNVHGVVHGDDAHQPVLRVHNGQGQKVVLVQDLGHVLLVVQGVGGNHMGVHDVPDDVVLLRQQDGPDGEIPQQVAALINDVADVDGLLVRASAADALQGVLHCHGGLQVHVLRGHDAAGAVVGIFQDLVDALAHLRVRVAEDPLDHVGGHLLHDVHGVVQIQLVQHFLQLGVGEALDQHLLLVAVQFHEYLRRLLLGQQAEHQGQGLLVQLPAEVGDVLGLQGKKEVAQLRVAFSGDQILDFFQQLVLLLLLLKHVRILLSACLLKNKKPGRSVRCGRESLPQNRDTAPGGPCCRSSFSFTRQ